jgi:hypothetical protein
MSALNDKFEKCVERKLMKDGSTEIHCKMGLWGVSGQDKEAIEKEARNYWIQYFSDGEYEDILYPDKFIMKSISDL